MEPYNSFNYFVISSACAKVSEQTGIENLVDEIWCADQLNFSVNNIDWFDRLCNPECVVGAYFHAVDDEGEPGVSSSQMSTENEVNVNFNHNVNPEPCPNEGCGCTGSYNGGAGAGTAVCCDCQVKRPSCDCQDDTYQTGLVNKKPECTDKYVPVLPGPPPPCPPKDSCCHSLPAPPVTSCCPYDADTYQSPLTNKKPHCTDKYIPELPPPEPYCRKGDCSCCASCKGCPDTYELIRNTDAQRYKGKGLDRSHFFSDDCCGCRRDSCNSNNFTGSNSIIYGDS